MRAYWIQIKNGQSLLEAGEAPMPVPSPEQLLIKVHAAALNRGEFIAGHGLTGDSKAARAGIEAAGEVVQCGDSAAAFETGARVMGRVLGAYAEYALMDAREAIPVPQALSWEQAAAVPITFSVVHDMLIGQGRIAAGEWLLIAGVSSGVGVAALQAGKALGAKVIGTSGSAQKLDRLKGLGLDVPIKSRAADFSGAVLDATANHGADLVVNTVGGTVFAECVRSLAFQGRIAMVGYLDRVMHSEIDLAALHARRLRIFGVSNKHRDAAGRSETTRGFIRDLLPAFAVGRIRPLIDRVFNFDEIPEARRYMESDAQTGKIVVRVM
ncbi:MAG: zinc-binding alcohol dehydrogenase [Betaproteobacteria bacterium RIFCSPLOWO2_02_FULL_62_17]|nr:MAG: zinc-binding alcohol dehydrogenase [Betaproteobacteria bacterium RIFCSPLOWO2_02_FULL_62_17]